MDKNVLYRKIIEGCRSMADLLEEELRDSDKPAEPIVKTQAKPVVATADEEKKISLSEVRAVLSAKSGAGHASEVRMLLDLHGAKKLSEVKEEDYDLLLRQAQKAELFGQISEGLKQQEANGFGSILPALFDHHYAKELADLKPEYYESFLRDLKELNHAE
jgi:hypothetical protein